ncbi:MAG: hypothetical protein Fur0016_21770 [Anaerolineales bacterium]
MGRLVPSAQPWTLEDLRLLDASFAPEPASDITAIFARPAGTRCEIRLDFLDLPDPPEYHFTLSLGDRVTVFSSASPPPPNARLQVDTVTDIIHLSLAGCRPQADTLLLVETATERLQTPLGARVDIEPLPLQFIFTNTFSPAATPIQAWRRWDGAHTGPRGERHGLHGLLKAAEKHQIPLTLSDTNTPAVLSAIDAVGGTAQLRRMEKSGLLALTAGSPPTASFLQFELSRNGLPLEARQRLLSSVVPSASPIHLLSNPLPIGGDFQRSTWGTPEYADPAFAWLKARPYFVIGSTGLPVVSNNKPFDSISYTKEMLEKSDPALAQNYTWLVPVLEEAALWSQNPAPVAKCKDLCILASSKFYAVLNPHGGRLVFFFAGREQVIGPTAQFFIGLSDRAQWDLSKGEVADPAQIMGAFGDADDSFRPYQAEITENAIRFVSADRREKAYRLTESGLEAALSPSIESQIPLALAPQTRFTPGWAEKYRLERLSDGVRLQVENGPMVRIQISAGQVRAVDSFLDAIPSLASPENPNLELSPGFFLPFPLTIVHFSASEVWIRVRQ